MHSGLLNKLRYFSHPEFEFKTHLLKLKNRDFGLDLCQKSYSQVRNRLAIGSLFDFMR